MTALLTVLATAFAVPQLLPQLLRTRRTGSASGVSLPWAVLTTVSNTAWLVYFVSVGLWSGLIPVTSSAILAALIARSLVTLGVPTRRAVRGGAGWAAVLGTAYLVGGTAALGVLLAVAFAIQVAPSLWTAHRSPERHGISRPTWVLVAAEVSCWGTIGVLESQPPLVLLGVIGIVSSAAMLWLSRPGAGPTLAPRPVLDHPIAGGQPG